ncbi:MAG TPA: outer membrane lipoprotein-sorting protein [Blastocatellia bacterium]|nr:outer membrane lipoprotein-sorting protein [Blastocatellia bacterium]
MKTNNTHTLRSLIASGVLTSLFAACSNSHTPNQPDAAANRPTSGGPTANELIDRYRALDKSSDSTTRLSCKITNAETKRLQLTIYRKRAADGRRLMLVEFTSPELERDRDGLITLLSDGRVEGVRYVQSTDSFIVTDDPAGEDALFGMTLQELADGQPEKYDFTLAGEETFEGASVYRLDGKLKPGAESKFPRLVLLLDKQNFTAPQAEFYDNHNEIARRLTVSKTEQIGGQWTRTRWSIDNRLRKRKIDFEAVEVKYDQKLSDSIFTREHLKKIASK